MERRHPRASNSLKRSLPRKNVSSICCPVTSSASRLVLLNWPPPGHVWIGTKSRHVLLPQRVTNARASIPAETAAQTRIVSVDRIRLDPWKSVRSFKGIFCHDISEFESYMPSHAVRSLPANVPARLERQPRACARGRLWPFATCRVESPVSAMGGAVHGRRWRAPKTPTLLDVLWVRGRLKLQNQERSLPRVLDSNPTSYSVTDTRIVGGGIMSKRNLVIEEGSVEALARLQKQDEEFCRRLRAAIETGRECCPTTVFTEPCTNRPVSNYMRPD